MVIFVIVWPISLASVLQCYNTSFKISELTYQSQHMFSEMRPYFWQMQFAQSPAHILSIICAMSNIVYISTNYIRCLFAAGQNETENIMLCHQLQLRRAAIWRIGRQTASTENIFFSRKLSMHKAKAQARHILTSCLRTLHFSPAQNTGPRFLEDIAKNRYKTSKN